MISRKGALHARQHLAHVRVVELVLVGPFGGSPRPFRVLVGEAPCFRRCEMLLLRRLLLVLLPPLGRIRSRRRSIPLGRRPRELALGLLRLLGPLIQPREFSLVVVAGLAQVLADGHQVP